MALSEVSDPKAVFCLIDSVSRVSNSSGGAHKLDRLAVQAHEYIPFLFITNGCKTCGYLIVLDYIGKPSKAWIGRINVLAESQTSGGVFVSVIDDCLVWKGTKVIEG